MQDHIVPSFFKQNYNEISKEFAFITDGVECPMLINIQMKDLSSVYCTSFLLLQDTMKRQTI